MAKKTAVDPKTTKFHVGDKVRVTRKAKSGENNWNNSWVSPEMDEAVGKLGTVTRVSHLLRDVEIDFGPDEDGSHLGYPDFVLELVKRKKEKK